jgi:hypothetical protein
MFCEFATRNESQSLLAGGIIEQPKPKLWSAIDAHQAVKLRGKLGILHGSGRTLTHSAPRLKLGSLTPSSTSLRQTITN